MNKIRVNMAVEPNDIQTLHCSQYDTEERKFSVDLHENGVGVSPSSISNQLVYKSFKGGTEQILPTNTSTPSTSPIIADIQYKDGLREDEEFLYRESPSDVDGYAKIKEIRGNTLVWNQIVQNGNFADSSVWTGNNASVSIANNKCNVTVTVVHSSCALRNAVVNGISGHKYLGIMTVTSPKATACAFYLSGGSSNAVSVSANVRTVVYGIVTPTSNTGGSYFYINRNTQLSVNDTVVVENVMFIDLTQMFGSGNEPSTVEEFTNLFPLPYYSYSTGSLLSFNGTGIKTTKADTTDLDTLSLPISTYFPDGMLSAGSVYDELTPTSYVKRVGIVDLGNLDYVYDSSVPRFYTDGLKNIIKKTTSSDIKTNIVSANYENLTVNQFFAQERNMTCMGSINGNISFINTSYSTTASFKSAMSGVYLYYELNTPLQNYGVVDMGTLGWYIEGNTFVATVSGMKANAYTSTALVCNKYITSPTTIGNLPDKAIRYYGGTNKVLVKDTSYNDATAFTTAMSGIYLLYELNEPKGITSASIVTNYGEMPLYNDNGELKADCISDVSQNSGFQIAKVKLKDENGEIYSNPFQIHTERSPQ